MWTDRRSELTEVALEIGRFGFDFPVRGHIGATPAVKWIAADRPKESGDGCEQPVVDHRQDHVRPPPADRCGDGHRRVEHTADCLRAYQAEGPDRQRDDSE